MVGNRADQVGMRNVGQLPGYANTKNRVKAVFHVFFFDQLITGRIGRRVSQCECRVCGRSMA
jgi:hypothetical protein